MSRDDERVRVSTNGRHAPTDGAGGAGGAASDEPLSIPTTEITAPETPAPEVTSMVGPDLRIAVTPAQAAVGFGILASLILLILRRRRRRRD